MEALFDKIRRVADQQVPVLVVGESGNAPAQCGQC
jgi:DNA-binding NtrC family response regulator